MDRIIKVTGKGKVSVKPDLIILSMNLRGVNESYEAALQQSSDETELIKSSLEKIGFKKSDIKTIFFNVNSKYENYRDKDNTYKNRFVGYEFQHNLKLEFNADNELLGRVLYAIAHSMVKPEFNISYTVKDKEAVKNEVIEKAIEDSRKKAEVLSKAAGVELKEIVNIDYSWGEVDMVVRPMNSMRMAAKYTLEEDSANSYDMSIEPENIDITDNVTVIWRIE